jgi:hypothetical protein
MKERYYSHQRKNAKVKRCNARWPKAAQITIERHVVDNAYPCEKRYEQNRSASRQLGGLQQETVVHHFFSEPLNDSFTLKYKGLA